MSPHLQFKFRYQIQQSENEERFEKCKKTFFKAFNILSLGVIVCYFPFTWRSETDVTIWNMTNYCESTKFDQIASHFSKFWAVFTILLVTILILGFMCMRMFLLNRLTSDLINIVNFFAGFMLSWDVCSVIQSFVSYPIPSFFRSEKLKKFYCSDIKPEMSMRLHELDAESRGSCPSFLMCSAWYTTTFIFLFVCHLDSTRIVVSRIMFLLIPAFISSTYGMWLWQHNNNHWEDIILGSVVGISIGTFIMKDLFARNTDVVRFKNDFAYVLMARELRTHVSDDEVELQNTSRGNEYTINLYPFPPIPLAAEPGQDADEPPPYTSI